jgi:DNA-binding SARP family transcriptional activator
MAAVAQIRAHTDGGLQAPHEPLLGRASASVERLAFNAFPYGLLVLDGGGRLVCRNNEAARLIDAAGLSERGLTCCALLGCRTPKSVLDGACVAELALAHGSALPEIRMEIGSPEGSRAMWVTAAPLEGRQPRVVLQLRPGLLGDRRKRTTPHWIDGPCLRVSTLGGTLVESAEGSIGGAWLDQRTGQLLKYLLAERRRTVTVDEIGESIWPDADYAVGTSVRYYVHALRRRLEPERGTREPSAFIVARGGGYALDPGRVSVDADEFEARVRAGMGLAKHDPPAGAAEIEQGVDLYRGEFLAELPYAEWALPERHRLHELACAGLQLLADMHVQAGETDAAVRALERVTTLQPFDEGMHRRLMELDIERGHHSDAVRRYTALRARLRRMFGHDPAFKLADLARPRV